MTKGCYTCRRRRIICDNGQPTCRKCRDAGKECLGYQKPLVWVKGGVASRGKMMGRSFDDVKKPDGDSKAQSSTQAKVTAATNTPGFGFFSIAESSSATSSPSSGAHTSPESDTHIQEIVEHAGLENVDEEIMYGSGFTEEPDNRVVHVPRAASTDYIQAPWGLVDPLFKDMSQMSRFYLFHCTLCKPVLNKLSFLLTALSRQPTYGQRLCCIFPVQEPMAGHHFASRRLATSRTRVMRHGRSTLFVNVGLRFVPDALVLEQPLDQQLTSVARRY